MTTYEFGYEKKHFDALCQLSKKISGIDIDSSKYDMVYSRMVRIIRQLHLTDFGQYIQQLQDPGNTDLVRDFTNAITTNLTSFFREKHHFDELTNTVLPELMKTNARSKTIRIWSAGCSSGEEPYSIAFVVKQFFSDKPGWTITIGASDIDTNILKKARAGIYKLDDVKTIERSKLNQWFIKGTGQNDGLCKVKPDYLNAVDFFQCNLMDDIHQDQAFDIIFCRNVLIYFDLENQTKILDNFMNNLVSNGYLFTGHSESCVYHYKKTKLIGKTIYRKLT